jgi:DNA-binding IclR family transcriptional regulator
MPKPSSVPNLAAADAAPGGVAAVDKALSLLAAFKAQDESLSLTELAQRTRLHKSSALRLLNSLAHAWLVERGADGRYTLGRGITRLHQVQQATSSLERVVMPVLRQLVADTGESAAFHTLWGQGAAAQRVSMFRVDSPHALRDHFRAGDLLPMNSGVGARVLVAFSGDAALQAAHGAQALIAQTREQGYLAAVGDRNPELAGIAAPSFKLEGGSRVLLGALVLTMPAARFKLGNVQQVLAAAAAVGRALGAG